jgi:acyl dehydratase
MSDRQYRITLLPGGLETVERRIEHVVDERWLLAYATAVGDDRPALVDLERPGGITAHPVFPVCVEWPLIMNGSPGVDLSPNTLQRGLHVTHRIDLRGRIHGGDRLLTSCRLVALERRSVGTYLAVRLETTTPDGDPVVSTYLGMLYRGVQVEGAQPTGSQISRDVAVPNPTMRVASFDVDRSNAVIYTECARIWNPIHTDIRVARAGGLPQTVLHGTECLARAVSAVLTYLPSKWAEALSVVESRFGGVVLPGMSLRVMVSELIHQGDTSAVAFEVLTSENTRAIKDGYMQFDERRLRNGRAA